jgi:hypothetical protein
MFLTGYHGTTLANANKIISEHKFYPSTSDHEWLANGIYFYFNVEDALKWRGSEAILHTIIKIDDSEFLDIDSREGISMFYNVAMQVASTVPTHRMKSDFSSAQKNQCAVMKIIWDVCSEIKVIAASFPSEKTELRTIFDARPKRREFCLRDNTCIKYINLIKRGELND